MVGGGQGVQPYIVVGPEVSVLLSAKVAAEGSSGGVTANHEEDIKDQAESLELALNAGFGLMFPMASFDLGFDARYGLGLTKINKEGDSVRNNVIFVDAIIQFHK